MGYGEGTCCGKRYEVLGAVVLGTWGRRLRFVLSVCHVAWCVIAPVRVSFSDEVCVRQIQ